MTLDDAMFVSDVLRTPLGREPWLDDSADVSAHRKRIHDRYEQLKRNKSFWESSRQARAEWLLDFVAGGCNRD